MQPHRFIAYLHYQDLDADPLKMVLTPSAGKQFATKKLDQAVTRVLENCEKDKGYTKRKKEIQDLIKDDPYYTIAAGKKLYEVEFGDSVFGHTFL